MLTKAVILANGEIRDYGFARPWVDGANLIICADGGLRHAVALGVKPDALVGDLDSAPPELVQAGLEGGMQVHRYPHNKDQTDTELALELAVRFGVGEVVLLGCTGERLDHTVSNLLLLPRLIELGLKARLVNEKNEVILTRDRVLLSGRPGEYLSLIPLTPRVTGIKTRGLTYPLDGDDLTWGQARGVSNQFETERAEIDLTDGWLMIVLARD